MPTGVYQLPLGVVGIAVGVVLLPELARALKAGHMRDAANLQNRSLEFALFLTLPAAAALWVMAPEIVRVLYERGAFSPATTHTVARALAIFGLGLPAFVMIKAFTPGYFAREDTRTPMVFAAISVVVNVTLALTLFPRIAEAGIATAEAGAGWINATLLLTTLVRRGHWTRDGDLMRRLPRLVLSAAVMAVGLQFAIGYAEPYLSAAIVDPRPGAGSRLPGRRRHDRLFRPRIRHRRCRHGHDPAQSRPRPRRPEGRTERKGMSGLALPGHARRARLRRRRSTSSAKGSASSVTRTPPSATGSDGSSLARPTGPARASCLPAPPAAHRSRPSATRRAAASPFFWKPRISRPTTAA